MGIRLGLVFGLADSKYIRNTRYSISSITGNQQEKSREKEREKDTLWYAGYHTLSRSNCPEISFALTTTGKFNVGNLYHAP
jgi:hypothetical protein